MATTKNKIVKKSASQVSSVKSVFQNYAPAPESSDHVQLKAQYDLFINGKFEKPVSKKYFSTINPATEEKLSMVAAANEADVNPRGIGGIEIAEGYSIVELPEGDVDRVIQALRGATLRGRKVKVNRDLGIRK
jgi:hypothetical protein